MRDSGGLYSTRELRVSVVDTFDAAKKYTVYSETDQLIQRDVTKRSHKGIAGGELES